MKKKKKYQSSEDSLRIESNFSFVMMINKNTQKHAPLWAMKYEWTLKFIFIHSTVNLWICEWEQKLKTNLYNFSLENVQLGVKMGHFS